MLLCRCFDSEEHANEFLDGKIRMMSLEYYRKKEADENGRKDKFEGTQKLWQGQHTTIKIFGHTISGDNGLGFVQIRTDDFEQNTKICCCTMLQLANNEINVDSLMKFNLPYCVIFTDAKAFLLQYINAAKEKNISAKAKAISFYDEKTYSGDLDEFMKPKAFEWQNEFRLALYTEQIEPVYLEIGDLHKIAHLYKTEDLIKELLCAKINVGEIRR